MATLIFLRHARSMANSVAMLAGRTPGVGLHHDGLVQADALVGHLAHIPIVTIISSPLQRCLDTVAPLAAAKALEPVREPRFIEVDYGTWTGRFLKELIHEPLWTVVHQQPEQAVFPGGEGLSEVAQRAVAAVAEWNAIITAEHGPDAVGLICSHGDVIKAILTHALGNNLAAFHQAHVDPGSLSVVHYSDAQPQVWSTNVTSDNIGSAVQPT